MFHENNAVLQLSQTSHWGHTWCPKELLTMLCCLLICRLNIMVLATFPYFYTLVNWSCDHKRWWFVHVWKNSKIDLSCFYIKNIFLMIKIQKYSIPTLLVKKEALFLSHTLNILRYIQSYNFKKWLNFLYSFDRYTFKM